MTDTMNNLALQLLLEKAVAFDFDGMVDGCGFRVRVTRDVPESDEGRWCLIRYDQVDTPWDAREKASETTAMLCDRDAPGATGFFWVPWVPFEGLALQWLPMGYDQLEEAVQVALKIGRGELRPKEVNG